jgi:hypothetical protein
MHGRQATQLKAALMSQADEQWVEALPLLLLVIHSVWRVDLKASSAERFIPAFTGGNLLPFLAECTYVTDFLSPLRVHIGNLRLISVSRNAAPSTLIFKDLATASRVFLRQGALRGPSKTHMSVHSVSSKMAI